MKLSDVMSAMHLASYAEVGLVLFFTAFLAVVYQVLRRGRALEELRTLPFATSILSEATPPIVLGPGPRGEAAECTSAAAGRRPSQQEAQG